VARVRSEGRDRLLESEGYEILAAAGFRVPVHRVVRSAEEAMELDLSVFGSSQVVVKVMAPEISHRADIGGVTVVPCDREHVADAVQAMQERFAAQAVGYLIAQFIEHDRALGAEVLVGIRWTDEFGPVLTIGPGGVDAEDLCRDLVPGTDVAVLSPTLTQHADISMLVERTFIGRRITGATRGGQPRLTPSALRGLVVQLLQFAQRHVPADLAEIEMNPVALTAHGPVVLDVLARAGTGKVAPAPLRPVHKLRNLLKPKSIAVIGVSERMNPGRRILGNILREGFDPRRVFVVKPGRESLDGCACVPDLAGLPEAVDMLVVSLDAACAVATVEESIKLERAQSILLIPGGMGEHEDGQELENRLRSALARSRETPDEGPVINGGNCLGIQSAPGSYDTMFIPEEKMPARGGTEVPVALIAQSGAFACSRASKLPELRPLYNISIGNQADLTAGDYLSYLADDPHVEIFACYIEGFRPLDGERFLRAARTIRANGGSVIVYRAGRTLAGMQATSSHTAALAGDYVVARQLMEEAGVLVAPDLAAFEEMTRLICLLRARRPAGLRLGALSNAGFEAVAFADNCGPLQLVEFGEETVRKLDLILEGERLDRVVAVQNPLDLTPIAGDAAYDEAARAVLEDPAVDVGIVGCVPMTGALATLPDQQEDEGWSETSVGERLIRLHQRSDKPWVAVVDAGPMYDALAARLLLHGVPTFRTADRALQMLGACCRHLVNGR
jgi:acyl-CoA synthetase (NDP forming)